MNDTRELSRVQSIIWDIMKELLPIIESGGYKYYMLGGTLLGAVRHRGFIPWDDDIDIGMPRDDYERFIASVSSALPEHLKLRTYTDDSPHHYYFSRIVDTRHELRRTGSTVERNEDIWVDIFPLDGMPNGRFLRYIHMLRLLYIRMRYHIASFDRVNLKRPGRPLSERIVIGIVRHTGLGTRSDPRKWLDKLDRLLKKYPLEHSDLIINFMGQYKFKEMFPVAWYGEGTMYDFEDTELCGPCDYDKVLTRQYGDYMTPPENRNAHAAEFVR